MAPPKSKQPVTSSPILETPKNGSKIPVKRKLNFERIGKKSEESKKLKTAKNIISKFNFKKAGNDNMVESSKVKKAKKIVEKYELDSSSDTLSDTDDSLFDVSPVKTQAFQDAQELIPASQEMEISPAKSEVVVVEKPPFLEDDKCERKQGEIKDVYTQMQYLIRFTLQGC